MKPNFAINFTDTSIALLHRTAKGWLKVGETPFDAPDLDEALDYLRKTALGLEPGGFTTKLVIPASQVLFTQIDVPVGEDAARRARISTALEGLTPYKADEVVFDWSGDGTTIKVAAVARETLTEAEGFATQHRFNPVSFVTIPAPGTFEGEPWFGPTEAAGAEDAPPMERDSAAISILGEGGRSRAKAEPKEPVAPPVPEVVAEPEPAPLPVAEAPAPEPEPVAAEPESEPTPAPEPEPELLPESSRLIADAAPFDAELTAALQAESEPEPAPEPTPAPRPQTEFRFAEPAPLGGPTDPVPPAEPAPQPVPVPRMSLSVSSVEPVRIPAPPAAPAPIPPVVTAPPPPPAPLPPVAEPEEAPFAHIPDNAAFPEDDDDMPVPPLPVSTRRPSPLAADPEDDLPPPPSNAVMSALANRRAEGTPPMGRPPTLPSATRPASAALSRAARGKPIEDLPPMPRPPQAPARPGPAAAAARGVMSKGLSNLVTAPAIPGSRKVKAKPGTPPGAVKAPISPGATAAVAATAEEAARSLGKSPFGPNGVQRGKPRYLGLILTALLLVCLALVAAWSSFFLASRASDETVAVASAPAIEDEAAADGQDPEALADGATGEEADLAAATPEAAPEAPPEAAPDAAVASDSPTAVTLGNSEDEIFLSAADSPPPAFDALSLPAPQGAEVEAPAAPMPPPPFGMVYQFDADGLIVPMAEGIPSPDGYTIWAGKPAKLPPSRSAAAETAATEAKAAAEAAALAAASIPAVPVAPGAVVPGATAPAAVVEAVPLGETAVAAAPAAQPNPDLADRRPRARPEGLAPATADDDAALATAPVSDFASLRPRARPELVLAAGERARAETAAASLATDGAAAEAEVLLASAAVPAVSANDAANPSLLTISRRPAAKPKDFSRAVEAAVAAAVRSEPAPAPEPEAEPAPKKTAKAAEPKAEEVDEANEPAVASAAPKIPTKASVAKQATFKNAINLSKINLIGVYGSKSNRYALIRQSNGRFKKVSVGDKVDGGRIEAITQTEVRYQKGGRLVTLAMPKT